jgi:hypothetical protein
LTANSIQIDVLAMLLIEKSLITGDAFHTKFEHVEIEYQKRLKINEQEIRS